MTEINDQASYAFLRPDGTVVSDKSDWHADTLHGVVYVDLANQSFFALKSDGTLAVAGGSMAGETILPAGISNNVAKVDSEERSSIILIGSPVVAQPPQITHNPAGLTNPAASTATFSVTASGT